MGASEEVFVIDGNTVTVRAPEGKKGALPVVYLNVFQGDGAEVWERLGELDCAPLALVAVGDIAWERDMTPWPAEPATRNEPPIL